MKRRRPHRPVPYAAVRKALGLKPVKQPKPKGVVPCPT